MLNSEFLYHYDTIEVTLDGKESKAYDVKVWNMGNTNKGKENILDIKVKFAYEGEYHERTIEYLNYSMIHGVQRKFALDRSQFMCMFTQSFEKIMKEKD